MPLKISLCVEVADAISSETIGIPTPTFNLKSQLTLTEEEETAHPLKQV